MIRVNARELEAIRKIYPNVKIKRTRHSVYLIDTRGEELEAILNIARGRPSNRKRKEIYWKEHKEQFKRRF